MSEAKFVPVFWTNKSCIDRIKTETDSLYVSAVVISTETKLHDAPLYDQEAVNELMDTIDIKAQAGLCQMSHAGTREFLKDIRRLVLAIQGKGTSDI